MSQTENTNDPQIAGKALVPGTAGDSGANEPEFWRNLRAAEDRKGYAGAWLALLCRKLSGVDQAVVVLGPANRGPYTVLATWPEGSRGSPGLAAAVEAAVAERGPVVQGRKYADKVRERRRDAIAHPILVDEQLCGAVALEVEHRPEPELRELLTELEWGSAWLEALVRRRTFTSKDRLVTVLEMVATCLHYERFQASATAVATELAGLFACERVSIGFLRGRHIQVRALSHSASFGKKANLTRAIEAAMDEAVDQQATIVYPGVEDGPIQVVRSHAELSGAHGSGAICTVPFMEGPRFLGALMLERPGDAPFDPETVQLCEHAASLIGPVLDVKRRDDRWLIRKAFDSLRDLVVMLFGPRHVALKLSTLVAIAVIGFFTFAEGQYRITANATLEGTVQRVISAPMAGYIAEAALRAGDIVREGAVLTALDDRDLRLERLKRVSQVSQLRREYSEALASHDRAQVRILAAQIEQAETQIELLEQQLERTRIVAPFSGVIVAGDLSQSLGAPVERGDVLFELAPLDEYRVILEVDEREVSRVEVGQSGLLALSGLPRTPLGLVVENITPVSNAQDGGNFFRVEARLEETLPALRPGMEGVGKIDVERRKVAWIWSHKVTHWLRMLIWTWWP